MSFMQAVLFPVPSGLLLALVLFLMGHLVAITRVAFVDAFYVFFVMIVTAGYVNFCFLRVFNYYCQLVIVTDVRILLIKKTVFLKNNSDAIDLTKIQDMGVEAHGLLRNYLQYGQLVIILSTSAPPITIPYAPMPHVYLERVNRVKREHIIQRRGMGEANPNSN